LLTWTDPPWSRSWSIRWGGFPSRWHWLYHTFSRVIWFICAAFVASSSILEIFLLTWADPPWSRSWSIRRRFTSSRRFWFYHTFSGIICFIGTTFITGCSIII
jgi:hypothetical protein